MNYKIDFEQILNTIGLNFENNETILLDYVIKQLEYLESHNKNYTRQQYYKILDLLEIVKAIKEV